MSSLFSFFSPNAVKKLHPSLGEVRAGRGPLN